jgi:hypothetical protein
VHGLTWAGLAPVDRASFGWRTSATLGARAICCARNARGHASVAPPSSLMTCLRRIVLATDYVTFVTWTFGSCADYDFPWDRSGEAGVLRCVKPAYVGSIHGSFQSRRRADSPRRRRSGLRRKMPTAVSPEPTDVSWVKRRDGQSRP